MLDAAVSRIHDADRIRRMAKLELNRDAAQAAFDKHMRAHEALLADPELATAKAAAGQAERDLERNRAEYGEVARAEEVARRYKAGVKAEAEAGRLLERARASLARYQDEHADAAARLKAKQAAISASQATAARLRTALGKAEAEFADPGRIPYGAQVITRD